MDNTSIKSLFETGDLPTGPNFATLIDSMVGADTFPYQVQYSNAFAVNADGVAAFNGGSFTYDSGNERINVTASADSRGVTLTFVNENSTEYLLFVDIESVTGASEIAIYSQWSTLIGNYAPGKHIIKFTSGAAPGGLGNKVVFAATAPGSFILNKISLYTINADALIDSPEQTAVAVAETVAKNSLTLLAHDFEDGLYPYMSGYSITPTVVGGQLQANPVSGGQIVIIGYKDGTYNFDIPEYVDVYLDIEIVDSELEIQPRWSNTTGVNFTTAGTGKYLFRLRKVGDHAIAQLNHICITCVDGAGSIRINEVKVFQAENSIMRDRFVEIGWEAYGTNSENTRGVYIGQEAQSDQQYATILGYKASGYYDPTYGCASNNEIVVIGELAKGYGWRTTALGAKAQAGGQSSTALGAGAVCLSSHGLALGRGTYVPSVGHIGVNVGTVIANLDLYFENGWGHQFNTPASGISIGSVATPSTVEVKLHGQDALDARFNGWDSGTSYSIGNFVQLANKVYIALTANSNKSPDTNPTDWDYLHDTAGGVPASFNVAGGNIALHGGKGTGTGEGGEVRFYTAPANGASANQKNGSVLAGKFTGDSAIVSGTRFYLVDAATETAYRVKIGAADSGGTGKRALIIDN